MSQRSAWVRNPSGYRSGPNTPPRIVSHYPLPLARSDPRGRGGGRDSDARTPNVTHTHVHRRSDEQHHNTVLGLRARLGMPRSILCYSQLWDGELLQPGDGSKWFDPKTSSTRDAAVPQSMTNPYHTQKIGSEPPRMKPVMQKSDSPDARFVMTDYQHTYPTTVTCSEKPAKPGLTLVCKFSFV